MLLNDNEALFVGIFLCQLSPRLLNAMTWIQNVRSS